MNLEEVKTLALNLMNQHLTSDWTFEFDRAARRFGCCHYDSKLITVSAKLAALNEEPKVRDTILHEIAHAKAPRACGHGPEWKAIALAIGCNGERTFSSAQVVLPPLAWTISCDTCGYTGRRGRRKMSACAKCCRDHNGGRFSIQYAFRWTKGEVKS